MKTFRGKLAVVTGGGTGMGRELTTQLAAEGCHVAICDVSTENMAETKRLAEGVRRAGARVTTHVVRRVRRGPGAGVSRRGRDAQHATKHINLLFNNAGIGGGGSFVNGDRAEWERTFNVCWSGVYYCTRAFLPLLVASDEGCIVNTSSVNGFWASLGPSVSHTAYSSAKFAVKGFTEALITDLRLNAPHVKAVLVMPGHVGTSILLNSPKVLGKAGCAVRIGRGRRDDPCDAGPARPPGGRHDRRPASRRDAPDGARLSRPCTDLGGAGGDDDPRRRPQRHLARAGRTRMRRPSTGWSARRRSSRTSRRSRRR